MELLNHFERLFIFFSLKSKNELYAPSLQRNGKKILRQFLQNKAGETENVIME